MEDLLKKLLADSYILMLKTHNFHWNVKGPMFVSLHTLFEQHYNDLFLAVDEIAERIKALGKRAPGAYAEFQQLSDIKDSGETNSLKMVRELADSHKLVVSTIEDLVKEAESRGDSVTADIAIRRKEFHDKSIWMLETILDEG